MANNLRVFNTNSEYQSADLILPAVSYVVETDKVIYDYTPPTPPVFQGKWKATYQDSHVESAECDSSSEIVRNEIHKINLVSVEIGDCVTSIGSGAFITYTSLTTCTIGSGVTSIGNQAFYQSGLETITIPDSVTSIGGNAFQSCTSLTSCTIGNGVTSISDNALGNCSSMTTCTIGSGVTSIGSGVFHSCSSLTSIAIPSGVTNIGGSAFYNCSSLTSITVNAITPPTLGNTSAFNGSTCPIYVPSQSVNAYKSARRWNSYASRIQAIP